MGSNTGGIVGANLGKVEQCSNSGEIRAQGANVGGICGTVGENAEVIDCINGGEVYSTLGDVVGGICGNCYGGIIKGCYNSSTGSVYTKNSKGSGICGGLSTGKLNIENCYNLNTNVKYGICDCNEKCIVKNCYTVSSLCGGGSFENVFYISDTGESDNQDGTTAMTAADFASGKVTYLLNQGQENNETVWYQNIDSGTADSYPVLDSTHGTVYPCTPCTGVYSNTSGTAAEHVLIQDESDTTKHICENCAQSETHAPTYTADNSTHTISGKCVCGKDYGNVTLSAPAEDTLTYDGGAKEAKVTGSFTGVTPPTISYVKNENGVRTDLTEGDKPTDAGTYEASITCGSGENTAVVSVTYTIARATPSVATTPTVNTTYHPNKKLSDFNLDQAGRVNGVDGNTLSGSWDWATPAQTPQVYNSGYMATFTPDDQKKL